MHFFKSHKKISIIAVIIIVVVPISSVLYALSGYSISCGSPKDESYYNCKYDRDGKNKFNQACVDEYASNHKNSSASGIISGGFIPCPGTPQ